MWSGPISTCSTNRKAIKPNPNCVSDFKKIVALSKRSIIFLLFENFFFACFKQLRQETFLKLQESIEFRDTVGVGVEGGWFFYLPIN
tara:strand:+ start:146 stop:406 length:261 start_codon:yes stop_codon:yes gene_type:complete